MSKPVIKFKELHDKYIDAIEYIATYGIDDLNDSEQTYAKKIALLTDEYNEVIADADILFDEEEYDEEP